jgi:uncharacterized membrane protein
VEDVPLKDKHAGRVPEEGLVPSPQVERRSRVVEARRSIRAIKTAYTQNRTITERVADRLTKISGSTPFLAMHVGWFTVWILWNTEVFGTPAFDPFPFGLLTMVVSLEAIFLSIFVLISQGRESSIAELREEVALQVNLRIEAEVTKTLQLVAGLYSRLNQQLGKDDELADMLKPLDQEQIERELKQQMNPEPPPRRWGRARPAEDETETP